MESSEEKKRISTSIFSWYIILKENKNQTLLQYSILTHPKLKKLKKRIFFSTLSTLPFNFAAIT